jgi:C-terminal processing protease CtpA/Prc
VTRCSLPLAVALLLVLAAFAAADLRAAALAGRFNPYQKLGVFTKVLSYIESHYVEDLSETELMYGAARGLTDVLDPHSRFMDPRSTAASRRRPRATRRSRASASTSRSARTAS